MNREYRLQTYNINVTWVQQFTRLMDQAMQKLKQIWAELFKNSYPENIRMDNWVFTLVNKVFSLFHKKMYLDFNYSN